MGLFSRIDFKDLKAKAIEGIVAQGASSLPGEERAEAVVDQLIEKLDEAIHPKKPFGEFLSDFALRQVVRPILRGLVHNSYEELREQGRI